jgi:hypothetical protein
MNNNKLNVIIFFLNKKRNYRQHLRDKRFIENRSSVSQEAIEWAKNYKITMLKKKLEKEKSMLEEHLM